MKCSNYLIIIALLFCSAGYAQMTAIDSEDSVLMRMNDKGYNHCHLLSEVTVTAGETELTCSPTIWDVGLVDMGYQADKTFTVTNTGNADLIVTETRLLDYGIYDLEYFRCGDYINQFTITAGGGSFTLAPNASRNISVHFEPTSGGKKQISLSFLSNDPSRQPSPMPGMADYVRASANMVAWVTFNFGDVSTGSYADKTIPVTNVGLTTQSFSMDYIYLNEYLQQVHPDFSYVSGITEELGSGEVFNVIIRFSPADVGSEEAETALWGSKEPDEVLFLKGTGISSTTSLPDLIVSDVNITDGNGPDISYTVTVTNIGTTSTTGEFKTRIYLSADNSITPSDYQINDWNCYDILAAGQSKTSYELTSTVTGVPAGEYYMGAVTDAKQMILESNENNNAGYANSPKVTTTNGGSSDPDEPDEPAGNMVSNWSFSNGMNQWQFNTAEAGNAAAKIEGGVFHAQITNGGGNVWNVALYKNNLNIVNGKTYIVSFDARAASPRNILASVAMGVSPFWLYNFEPNFSITTEW
ncbi:choice-of-anchor D domain-containing protein, partial [bacterium]|nr:choice-of-anchor D domain-containing protein [bacterium]